MDIAGHVSKQMLKHYSHIRMEAKRRALESIVTVRSATATAESNQETGQAEGYPQESPHGLQSVGKPTDRKRATAKTGNTNAANKADLPCSESPTNTQGFDVGYPRQIGTEYCIRLFRGYTNIQLNFAVGVVSLSDSRHIRRRELSLVLWV
jgi:hypothetical protein